MTTRRFTAAVLTVFALTGPVFAAAPAVAAASPSPVARVVYAVNADGSWRVVEGNWRAIPRDGSASVTVVAPVGGTDAFADRFARDLRVHAGARTLERVDAKRWTGAARVIVTWPSQ